MEYSTKRYDITLKKCFINLVRTSSVVIKLNQKKKINHNYAL